MSDILKPITGKDLPKDSGKGAVFLVSDECVIKLTPTIYNSVPNCIMMELQHLQGCCDVRPEMPKREIRELLEEFEENCGNSEPLTYPMCHRSPKSAWQTAEYVLRAAADACQAQADAASDKTP